jgi:hypothetical protein
MSEITMSSPTTVPKVAKSNISGEKEKCEKRGQFATTTTIKVSTAIGPCDDEINTACSDVIEETTIAEEEEEEEEDCAICLCPLYDDENASAEGSKGGGLCCGHEVCELPCHHKFHATCITQLRSSESAKLCPLCRADLPIDAEELNDRAGAKFHELDALVMR